MIPRLVWTSRVAAPRIFQPSYIRCYSSENNVDLNPTYTSSSEEKQIQNLFQQLQTLPLEQVLTKTTLSPDVEQRLNAEFKSFITEFGLEADLTEDILKYVSESMVTPETIARSKHADDGGLRGKAQFPNMVPTEPDAPYSSQELFVRRLFHAAKMKEMGAKVENVYRPHNDIFHPPSVRQTTISTLLAAGCHLGHVTSLFRASNQPYMYGIRDGIHIIDLDQTLIHLRRAATVIEKISENGGLVLYVGTLPGQERSVQVAAERSNGYYVHSRWIPGTISNATQLSSTWQRHEVDMGDQPTGRGLAPQLKNTVVKPDMVVILNPVENRFCIEECNNARIPTIGLIDTNSEPTLVSYPIPCNDDSLRASDLMVGVLSRAARKGMLKRRQKFAQSVKNGEGEEEIEELKRDKNRSNYINNTFNER